MVSDRFWNLINGYRLEINESPQEFKNLKLDINLDAKKIEKNFRPPETISIWELKAYINNLEKSGFSVRKHIYLSKLFIFLSINFNFNGLAWMHIIFKERKS